MNIKFKSKELADAIVLRRCGDRETKHSERIAARNIGISLGTLRNLERETYVPNLENYARVCFWLGVSLDTFVEKENEDDGTATRSN